MGDEVSNKDREQRAARADVGGRLSAVGSFAGLVGDTARWLRDEEAACSNPATPTQVRDHFLVVGVAFSNGVQQRSVCYSLTSKRVRFRLMIDTLVLVPGRQVGDAVLVAG